jgi:hypothetical protein
MKKSNWPSILACFIEEHRHKPFVWGDNDCCLFACNHVTVMGNPDPAKFLKIRKNGVACYHDAKGARRVLKRLGGIPSIVDKVAGHYGWVANSVAKAQRADLVEALVGGSPTLGVCVGQFSAFVAQQGLLFHPTINCTRSWNLN